jgi:hypothetical protein
MKIKTRALRQRVWFRALSRVERGIIDLTIGCVEKVRSPILVQTLLRIISKILGTLEEGFMIKAETVGREIAEKLCVFAERWGNKTLSVWKYDRGFVKFLGVNALNTSTGQTS